MIPATHFGTSGNSPKGISNPPSLPPDERPLVAFHPTCLRLVKLFRLTGYRRFLRPQRSDYIDSPSHHPLLSDSDSLLLYLDTADQFPPRPISALSPSPSWSPLPSPITVSPHISQSDWTIWRNLLPRRIPVCAPSRKCLRTPLIIPRGAATCVKWHQEGRNTGI